MTSINFKVISLTRPGFKPMMFGFPDLQKRETDVLLIHCLVRHKSMQQTSKRINLFIKSDIVSVTSLHSASQGSLLQTQGPEGYVHTKHACPPTFSHFILITLSKRVHTEHASSHHGSPSMENLLSCMTYFSHSSVILK